MQHFFLAPENFQPGRIVVSNGDVVYQMQRVLRMRPGDEFIALDGTGRACRCLIEAISPCEIHAKILKEEAHGTEPEIFVTLFQALPKKMELFEWVLQKGTEIGVSRFVPLITERTERDFLSKRERLERILKEAAEQSERRKIPELAEVMELPQAFERRRTDMNVLLYEGGGTSMKKLVDENGTQKFWNLFIGPEGGFSEKEVALAKQKNLFIGSLGPRILRTETAGIAAASLVLLG